MFPELRGEHHGSNRARGYSLLEALPYFGAPGVTNLCAFLATNGAYLHRFESFLVVEGATGIAIIVTAILRNLGSSGARADGTSQGGFSFRIPVEERKKTNTRSRRSR